MFLYVLDLALNEYSCTNPTHMKRNDSTPIKTCIQDGILLVLAHWSYTIRFELAATSANSRRNQPHPCAIQWPMIDIPFGGKVVLLFLSSSAFSLLNVMVSLMSEYISISAISPNIMHPQQLAAIDISKYRSVMPNWALMATNSMEALKLYSMKCPKLVLPLFISL